MGRAIGAVLAGFLVVGVVVAALQYMSTMLFPVPEGIDPFDPSDADAFLDYVMSLPLGAWLMAYGSELFGAFLGALTAGKIASSHQTRFAGAIVGIAVIASIINWVSFPHPTWFIVGQLVCYPLVFLAASRLLAGATDDLPPAA